jgi:DNA invertase Pin-like site-specific DNA recombinase
MEIESGGGDDRPELAKALAMCRIQNAVLVIAKLDRLSRDPAFLLRLQKAGVRFVAADMPDANEAMVGFMAVMAGWVRKIVGERTRLALQAAKARGTKLGNPCNLMNQGNGRARGRARRTEMAKSRAADLAPILADVQTCGASSLREIAGGLNSRGIPAAPGGEWSAMQVKRLLEQI